MILLHIEHQVTDFDRWKAAFDSDPVGRQKSGVRCYRVMRSIENPNFVIIDLEFDALHQAEALVNAMQQVWTRTGGILVHDPQWQITEIVEARNY